MIHYLKQRLAHTSASIQGNWQGRIAEDLEALAERKLVQAAKEVQFLEQREAARQAVLLEEGPQMRETLQDKVCQSLFVLKCIPDYQSLI